MNEIEKLREENEKLKTDYRASLDEAIEFVRGQNSELHAEIARLRECAARAAEAVGKTISVELPSAENGNRFFVTAPHDKNEQALADCIDGAIKLFSASWEHVVNKHNEKLKARVAELEGKIAKADTLAEALYNMNCLWGSRSSDSTERLALEEAESAISAYRALSPAAPDGEGESS